MNLMFGLDESKDCIFNRVDFRKNRNLSTLLFIFV